MNGLTVGEVMTSSVVSVRQHTPFKELARLMRDHDISGLPVLDESGCLVGIVTEADLLEVVGGSAGPKKRHTQLGRLLGKLVTSSSATFDASAAEISAGSLMTTELITTNPETPVREAARKIVETGVKRLPVVDGDNRVVGIVSRQDLLRPYLREDDRISEEVLESIAKRLLWIDPSTIKILVEQGIVKLHGVVAKRSQKDILIELTRRVDGVVGVEDHMRAVENDRDSEPEWLRKESAQAEPWAKVAHMYGYQQSDKR